MEVRKLLSEVVSDHFDEPGIAKMLEHRYRDDAPSRRLQAWRGRCASYYGVPDMAHVTQWQREAYVRVARDAEPKR